MRKKMHEKEYDENHVKKFKEESGEQKQDQGMVHVVSKSNKMKGDRKGKMVEEGEQNIRCV